MLCRILQSWHCSGIFKKIKCCSLKWREKVNIFLKIYESWTGMSDSINTIPLCESIQNMNCLNHHYTSIFIFEPNCPFGVILFVFDSSSPTMCKIVQLHDWRNATWVFINTNWIDLQTHEVDIGTFHGEIKSDVAKPIYHFLLLHRVTNATTWQSSVLVICTAYCRMCAMTVIILIQSRMLPFHSHRSQLGVPFTNIDLLKS